TVLAVFVDPFARIPADSHPGEFDGLRFRESESTVRIYLALRMRFIRQIMQAWAYSVVCVVLAVVLMKFFSDTQVICTMWGVCLFYWARAFGSFRVTTITIDRVGRTVQLSEDGGQLIPFSRIRSCRAKVTLDRKTASVVIGLQSDSTQRTASPRHIPCDSPKDAFWLAAKIDECMDSATEGSAC
ncbi:MAG: hypothetical protein KDB27_30125, partial [Planctomycetales bacterium]|nr:hypothetical protein [Planctomycetales bacterium]